MNQRETAHVHVAAWQRQKKEDEQEEDSEFLKNLEMLMEENVKDESCFWSGLAQPDYTDYSGVFLIFSLFNWCCL